MQVLSKIEASEIRAKVAVGDRGDRIFEFKTVITLAKSKAAQPTK